ncbi:MAG: hypothetical protein RIK87_08430 [Fuerstiella sp.]
MRAIEDVNGNSHHAKLRLENLEQIKIATGLEIAEVDDASQPLPRLFSSPLKMWKVVDILIGHRLRTETESRPDYSELFDIDDVVQWLEDLITDFHPKRNRFRLSKRFADVRENLETIMDAIRAEETAVRTVTQSPEMLSMVMKNPAVLSALATGSEASSALIPRPSA